MDIASIGIADAQELDGIEHSRHGRTEAAVDPRGEKEPIDSTDIETLHEKAGQFLRLQRRSLDVIRAA